MKSFVTLPYPPSVNTYWRSNRGRVHVSKTGVEYRRAVGNVKLPVFGGSRLRLTAMVYPPDKRRRDLDNVLKALLDALCHAGAYNDDSQIDLLTVRRCSVMDGGCVDVAIEEMS
jgi:crossover junction endodeoxyribonuclease RusA